MDRPSFAEEDCECNDLWRLKDTELSNDSRYSSNCNLMNSSEPVKPIVLGRLGFAGSHVSITVLVKKSIQRLSAAERDRAERREGEVILTVRSSRLINMSLYLSFCWRSREFVEPTM